MEVVVVAVVVHRLLGMVQGMEQDMVVVEEVEVEEVGEVVVVVVVEGHMLLGMVQDMGLGMVAVVVVDKQLDMEVGEDKVHMVGQHMVHMVGEVGDMHILEQGNELSLKKPQRARRNNMGFHNYCNLQEHLCLLYLLLLVEVEPRQPLLQ